MQITFTEIQEFAWLNYHKLNRNLRKIDEKFLIYSRGSDKN